MTEIPHLGTGMPHQPSRLEMIMAQQPEFRLHMLQDLFLAEIQTMQQVPGMEVFFNIEGLPRFTAELMADIIMKPGETFVVATAGGSGIGKEAALQGMLKAMKNNQSFQLLLQEERTELEIFHMTTSDALKKAQDEGDVDKDKWAEQFDPNDLRAGSEWATRGIAWAFTEKPRGKSITRVVLNESIGIMHPDPLNPNNQHMPIQLDIGSLPFAIFGRHPNFYGLGIATDIRVQDEVSFPQREPLWQENPSEPNVIFKAHGNTTINTSLSPQHLRRTFGTAEMGRIVRHATNLNMFSVKEQLNVGFDFTLEDLKTKYDLRKSVEKAYINWLFDRWGVEKRLVESNDKMAVDDPNEEQRKSILLDREELDKYRFPWKKVYRLAA